MFSCRRFANRAGTGVWKIIRPWLDPVIAAKINFTKNNKELLKFIEADQLQKKDYNGTDPWEYKYIELEPGEEERMQSEKKPKLQAERNELIQRFEQLTLDWARQEPGSASFKEKEAEKNTLTHELHDSYWRLDPYIRARSYYHRANVIQPMGAFDFKAAR